MPLFRITKKLADALNVKLPKGPTPQHPAQQKWFADLFYVQGKKCVIWVHRKSLLAFVRPAVVVAELREFHGLFRYKFRTTIASMALPEALIDRFGIYHPEVYAPTNDRAIVGSMLDYRKMFEVMVEYEGGLASTHVAALNAQLNETPMSVLGMESALSVVCGLVDAGGAIH